jgi:hypothetical protein
MWRFIRSKCLAVTTFCLSLVVFSLATPVSAQALALKTGTYNCFTLSTLYVPNPQRTDSTEVARVGAGNVWVRPMVAPQLLLAPAVFGNVVLDGRGNYRLTNMRQGGQYGFNTRIGRPTFTGDLGAMQPIEYSGTGTSFVVGWQGMNFECGLTGPGGPLATANNAQDQALTASAGPALGAATASQFTGHFEGHYRCNSTQTFMQLDLQARTNGTLTGVFKFGGMKTPEFSYSVGSFTLTGTWRDARFELKKGVWITQPQGYEMFDIEGTLTNLGVSGKVGHSICSVFAARRVNG